MAFVSGYFFPFFQGQDDLGNDQQASEGPEDPEGGEQGGHGESGAAPEDEGDEVKGHGESEGHRLKHLYLLPFKSLDNLNGNKIGLLSEQKRDKKI